MTPNNANITQLDFDIYPGRRLTAAIKETAKDLKSEKKEEVWNSEIMKKKHFDFGFSDFLPQRKLASVNIVGGVSGGSWFCFFFLIILSFVLREWD